MRKASKKRFGVNKEGMILDLLILISLFRVVFPQGDTYYVDCEGTPGDGTSPSTPFLNLNDLTTIWPSPPSGSSFLLKRGCQWNEDLTLADLTGTEAEPILVGAYGAGDLPTLTGYTSLNELNWQHLRGEIYYADVVVDIKQLFVRIGDEVQVLNISRYPPNAPYEGGFFHVKEDVDSGDPTIRLFDSESSDFFALDDTYIGPGTIVVAKLRHWIVRAMTISSVNRGGETLSVSSVDSFGIPAGYGFFLVNRLAFLVEEGSWVYDSTINRLYVWLPGGGGSPSSSSVDIFHAGHAGVPMFQCWNCEHVIIENIRVEFNGGDSAFQLGDCNSVTVQDCEIRWTSEYGLVLHPTSQNVIIRRNRILHTLVGGLVLWSYGEDPIWSHTSNCVVTENLVDGVGEFGGYTRYLLPMEVYQDTLFQAVTIHGTGHTVSHNEVCHTGRDGIAGAGESHHIVENYIHDIGSVVDDVGMIYLFGTDHLVERNIGQHCYGNTHWGTPDEDGNYIPCEGLYTDVEATGVTFTDNVISDVYVGVVLYNSQSITVTNNILFNTWDTGIWIGESTDSVHPQGWACCHTIENNLFVNAGISPNSDERSSVVGFFGDLGNSDDFVASMRNNRYYGYNPYVVIKTNGPDFSRFSTVWSWQEASGWDAGAEMISINERWTPNEYSSIISDNLIANGDFSWGNVTGWSSWDNSFFSMECVDTWNTDGGNSLKSTYVQAPKNENYFYAVSTSSFSVSEGQSFLFKYTIGADLDEELAANIREDYPPDYMDIFYRTYNVRGGEKISDEFVWTYQETETIDPARIDFQGGLSADSYFLDDVELYRVTLDPLFKVNPDRALLDFTLFTNPSVVSIEISTDRPYCDIDGNELPRKLSVGPYAAVLAVNCFCNFDTVCNNEETKATCPEDCGESFVGSTSFWVIIGVVSSVVVVLAVVAVVALIVVVVCCAKKRNGVLGRKDTEMRTL